MDAPDIVIVGLAAVLLVPILLNPISWPIFALAALLVLVGGYGIRYLLDLEKQRRSGERGRKAQVRRER